MTVKLRLAAALEKSGSGSHRELARRSGVSLVTINGIANNRTTRVDLETLDKLCDVLEREQPKRKQGK